MAASGAPSPRDRDSDVIHAEIDTQDRTMMDQVIEDEVPQHHPARQGEERRSSVEQRPRLRQLVVFHCHNRLPGRGDIPIKQVEDLLTTRQLRGLIEFAADRGEVPRGRREDSFDPAEDLGEVVGVPADRVRFGMGLPVELVLRNPLQHLAGVRHLPVELW